ncbi:hypothetical protein ACTFIR_002318 [Dictyostelium discoideum]
MNESILSRDFESLAFKDNCKILSKLKKLPNNVMLLNGFNQKLTKGIIPEGVKELVLGDIKQDLIIGSIPNTVTTVTLFDGFNQKLTKGIIPDGVKEIRLGDIKQELVFGSIPNTVTTVTLCDGFGQKLTKGIIPECVKELHIGDIKQDLIGSIPNTLAIVYIYKSCEKSIECFVPENVKTINYNKIVKK